MKNQIYKPFVLTVLVILALLALFYLPRTSLMGHELRRVNILSEIQRHDADGNNLAELMADSIDGVVAEHFDSTAIAVKTVAYVDSIPEGMTPIEDFSDDSENRVMDYFYEALSEANERPVRIAYFGDSYIEGDIITADLRELYQQEYGGNGVGFIDINSLTAGFRTTVRATAKGWQDYNANDDRSHHFNQMYQGINGRYYVPKGHQAAMEIKCQYTKYANHLSHADMATIFFTPGNGLELLASVNGGEEQRLYSVDGEPTIVEQTQTVRQCHTDTVWAPDSTFVIDTTFTTSDVTTRVGVQAEGGIQKKTIEDITSLKLKVMNGESSRFYGVALDGKTGVAVDNFSMRGSNGWYLADMPENMLNDFNKIRPYDLIIIHFGLNTANEKQKDYSGYTRRMIKSIEHLKKNFPSTSILVISVADRAAKSADGQMHTMSGIKELIGYQRKMASDGHIAFWNLHEAMGGDDSVIDMVNKKLANLDYTHINFAGGRHLAKILFEVLQNGKKNYDKRKE